MAVTCPNEKDICLKDCYVEAGIVANAARQ